MITVNIREAKIHLSELLTRVMRGEEVVIAKAGKPIARLLPMRHISKPRTPGLDAGKVVIHNNFDDPLSEFEL